MSDWLLYLLWAVVVFGLYRQGLVIWFFAKRRRAHRERFRGLRLVYRRSQ